MNKKKIRYGMVGGGRGAFIGAVHRIAAAMDQQTKLVCGAFSSTPKKSQASGEDLGLLPHQCYGTYEDMFQSELNKPFEQRMEFVVIVTPNHMHFPVAKLALESGFHVLCDKPVTFSLDEAKELETIIEKRGKLFCLTHNYTGYPMVKQARHMCETGHFGELRSIHVEYPQGWLATQLEDNPDAKQAVWRTDPSKSGIAGCMGDIGTHAANLVQYTTGCRISELLADLTAFVPGRALDDNGNVLLRFENGAKGTLRASQVDVGTENDLAIKAFGETGGFEWYQKEPNTLLVHQAGVPAQLYRTGNDYLCEAAQSATRTPPAHPEGYLEAFANVYLQFIEHIRVIGFRDSTISHFDYPTIRDGIDGMAFIEAVVRSSEQNAAWVSLDSLIK